MKIQSKKKFIAFSLVVILATIFSLTWLQGSEALAATVGDKLLEPEAGWQRIQETDSNLEYSSTLYWGKEAKYKYTQVRNEYVRFNFVGSKIRIIGDKDTHLNKNMIITIDDKQYKFNSYVDNYLKYTESAILFEIFDLSYKEHKVQITLAESAQFRFDAVDIDGEGEIKPYNPVPAQNTPVSSIVLNKSNLDLKVNDSEKLIATIEPENATDKKVIWSSNNPDLVEVDENGNVTAKAKGTAIITAMTRDSGKTATCNVTVTEDTKIVTSIELNKSTIILNVGQTEDLIATVKPDNAENKKVTWTSSDESIATVDENGKVTAIKAGNVTITAKTTDGSNLTATCNVTVVQPSNDRAILAITMTNGQTKEYDLPNSEIEAFTNWFDSSNGKGQPKFGFNKKIQPYKEAKEYVVFDKISSYEVRTYTVSN